MHYLQLRKESNFYGVLELYTQINPLSQLKDLHLSFILTSRTYIQASTINEFSLIRLVFYFSWYEMNCLIMEDPVRNLNLQAFSQPLMIPAKAVQHLHDSTPASYPLKESGFAVTVGQAVSEECNVIHSNVH